MKNRIEVLDLNNFLTGGVPRADFLHMLKKEFTNKGFIILTNHGIPREDVENAYFYMKKFFTETTLAQRLSYEYTNLGHQIGYTPLRVEKAVGAKNPDEKHFWHHRSEDKMPYVANVRGFSEANEKLFNSFRNCAVTMLKAVAMSLGLDETFFDDKEGNSTMRLIHYPASASPKQSTLMNEIVAGGNSASMCAEGHSDINFITLLPAKYKGLELLMNKKWIPVQIVDDSIIVNVGDMLQYFTNNIYKSGYHQVVCEKNIARYSMPYFGHVHQNVRILPLPQFGPYNPKDFLFATAGEYLDQRLKEIGLI